MAVCFWMDRGRSNVQSHSIHVYACTFVYQCIHARYVQHNMYVRGSTWSYASDVIRRIATQILQMCAKGNEDPGMDALVEECTSHTLALPAGVGINFV